MKTRLFSAFAFLASIALLALLVPAWALPAAAQSQPVAPGLPILSKGEGQAKGSAPGADRARGAEGLRSSPVMFIENVGQFADGARFQVRGADHTMWLADNAIWITVMEQSQAKPQKRFDMQHAKLEREDEQLRGVNLKLRFVGANPSPSIEPFDRLGTHVSYFIGNDPDQWHPDVPVWGGVRYKELYPGVDLEIAEEEDMWTWRLVTNDASALEDVRLQVEGADDLDLEDDLLHLTTAVREHILPLLLAVDSQDQPVRMPSGPSLTGHDVALPFRSSVSYLPAGIAGADDLRYATFLGGGELDGGYDIAVDGDGMAYVTGRTYSSNFPTTYGAYDRSYNGGSDVFVVKLNTTGSNLVYATFLGGGDADCGVGIAVDGSGIAYVTGGTYSSNFPTTYGAYDRSHNGQYQYDGFVAKLNATGSSLVYATFLGGGDYDYGLGIAVDRSGIAYVTGDTGSSNFPTTYGAYDSSYNGGSDVFVVKLNTTGSNLVYATFLGGGDYDCGGGIAVDGSGIAYVTGATYSSNFPTTYGAYDRSHNGERDVFVVKLNTTGSNLVYATFLGGGDYDCGVGIAVDGSGIAYVTGGTYSSNFPTTYGAYDRSHNGEGDVFVVKLNTTGSSLVYATFLGSGDYDYGLGIAVDGSGIAYV